MSEHRNLIQIHTALSNFKNFPVIDAVTAYDPHGFTSGPEQLGVVANISTFAHLPPCRVIVQVASIGAILLTNQQSEQLRNQLELAERQAAYAIALAADQDGL